MPVALDPSPAATVAPTNAAGATAAQPATGADFLLVLARQISAESKAPAAAAQAPSPNLTAGAALAELLAGQMPEGASQDSDTDTEDGDDSEEIIDVATLLAGFSAAPPAQVTANHASPARLETTPIAISATQGEPTDTPAADAFLEVMADPAAADTDAATATSTTAPHSAHAAQAHVGVTNHLAAGAESAQAGRELRSPVGTPAWNDELGGQLTWMAANGRESASLRLSPENLGPLDIRICVEDGEAKVWFGATNTETRAALESSLPRLRELFAAQGLVLADAGVFRDAPRDQASPANPAAQPNVDADSAESVSPITITHAGLIDTYV